MPTGSTEYDYDMTTGSAEYDSDMTTGSAEYYYDLTRGSTEYDYDMNTGSAEYDYDMTTGSAELVSYLVDAELVPLNRELSGKKVEKNSFSALPHNNGNKPKYKLSAGG